MQATTATYDPAGLSQSPGTSNSSHKGAGAHHKNDAEHT